MITDTGRAAGTPLQIARALAPRIRERAAEIEALRQLPSDLVMDIASAIFTANALERYARDAEVVTRHNQLQFVNYEAVGRTVLGLESNSPLF